MSAARLYLDWNASAPLRPEAKAAMVQAMELTGNASSVHGEGRGVKALIEAARAQVAEAFGAQPDRVVFTSGATEAAALCCEGRGLEAAPVEHEAVASWCDLTLGVDDKGAVALNDPAKTALQLANSETGILQRLPEGLAVADLTQALGKVPFAFDWSGVRMGILSAHKLGGPKGIGAVLLAPGVELPPRLKGGGQEMGRRAGTENVIGIAGFGAAAAASAKELAEGRWDEVADFRDILEKALEDEAPGVISVAKGLSRLPNTLNLIARGWKGETQVMAMDLAGFAVSAGSACSSGKVRVSKVLSAMGYDEISAASSLRVSFGPGVPLAELKRFAASYGLAYRRAMERMTARA